MSTPALSLRRLARFPATGRRLRLGLAGAAVLLTVMAGGWLWLRDSSLVSVEHVTVTGARGPDSRAIRRALVTAARGMTTLDVNLAQLRRALAPFPEVKSLALSTSLPHGLRIKVIEQLPVAMLIAPGHREAVSADGTLLHRFAAGAVLPTIALAVPPGGTRLTEPALLRILRALGAAPPSLLSKVAQLTDAGGKGLVAQLRGGPAIYLGDSGELRAKWLAAVAVLADPGSVGASYIDVTDPSRPAAGAGTDTASSGASAGSDTGASGGGAGSDTASSGAGDGADSGDTRGPEETKPQV